MFCLRVSEALDIIKVDEWTYDNGDETHGECAPEHAAHEVLDRGGEQALKSDISCDMADTEDDKDQDVEDEDDDAQSLQPTGIVRQVVKQDRCDTGPLDQMSAITVKHKRDGGLTMLSEKKAGARLSTAWSSH